MVSVLDYNNFKEMNDENDWLDPTHPNVPPYSKSKVLAEKAVWEYVKKLPQEEKFDVVVINPGFILGPILVKSGFTSQTVVQNVMTGKYQGIPDIYTGIVDVRDVADAHVIGVTTSSVNERFLLVENTYEFAYIGQVLYDEFKSKGYKVVRKKLSYCVAKMASCWMYELKLYLQQWGKNAQVSNEKARTKLGIKFIKVKDSIKEMGYSLIEKRYISDKTK